MNKWLLLLCLVMLVMMAGCSDSDSGSSLRTSSGSDTSSVTSSDSNGDDSDSVDSDDNSKPKADFPTGEQAGHSGADARAMAEQFVREKLGDPQSIQFQPDEPVMDLGANIFKVNGYLDSDGDQGVTVRSDFTVTLHWVDGDVWNCDFIKIHKHK